MELSWKMLIGILLVIFGLSAAFNPSNPEDEIGRMVDFISHLLAVIGGIILTYEIFRKKV